MCLTWYKVPQLGSQRWNVRGKSLSNVSDLLLTPNSEVEVVTAATGVVEVLTAEVG